MNTSDEFCEQAVLSCGKRLIPAVLLATFTFLFTPLVFGETVASCDEPGLRDALNNASVGDGIVEFPFDCTITLTNPITIPFIPGPPGGIVIDGGGQNVVLSGGSAVSVIFVSQGATLTLIGVEIAQGKATLGGAGVLNNGTLNVVGCRFAENIVTGSQDSPGLGGAILNHGTLRVFDSAFGANAVEMGDGGAIFSDGPSAFVSNTAFEGFGFLVGNFAGRNGGAIANLTGTLVVINSSFVLGNDASAGGAIHNSGTLDVRSSAFIGNTDKIGAGAIGNFGDAKVNRSLFVANTSGIANLGGRTLLVTNSTFSGNTRAGVDNVGNSLTTVDYSTLSGNSPNLQTGGGVGFLRLSDTILVRSSDPNCLFASSPPIDEGYNLADDNSCIFRPGSTSSVGTPDLGPLADNGGPTLTMSPMVDSPAIDKIPFGGINGCGTTITTDQRGVPRPQGFRCDIGAVEVNQSVPMSTQQCNGTFNGPFTGDLIVSSGQTCTFIGGSITGNILLQDGTLNLSYLTIVGSIEATGGIFSIGPSTTINGNLEIHNYPPTPVAQNTVCGTTINGNLQVHNNAAAVTIGSAPEVCTGNAIGGSLEVHNNSAPTQVLDNTVTGDLDVHNNIAATQVIGNVVKGNLTCHNNSSITGGPNPASKQVEDQCFQFTAK